jgi:hypothetical protein
MMAGGYASQARSDGDVQVSFYLLEPADVARAIDLLRMSFDLAVTQRARQ